jgi:hypothetical protein
MVLFSNPNAENSACNAQKYEIGSQTVSDARVVEHVSI